MKSLPSYRLVIGLILSAAFPGTGMRADPLKFAKVTAVRNDVNLQREGAETRKAEVKDKVMGRDRLWTGKKSRAEIEFSDKSIARLGSNTIFSFDPQSRNMSLDHGTALIHVPPGMGGAWVATPAAAAAVRGDTLALQTVKGGATTFISLSHDPKGMVLIQLVKNPAVKRELPPGTMVTVAIDARAIPLPQEIDVAAFVKTFPLLDESWKSLPSTAQKEIQQVISLQISREDGGIKAPPPPDVRTRTPLDTPEEPSPKPPPPSQPPTCPTG